MMRRKLAFSTIWLVAVACSGPGSPPVAPDQPLTGTFRVLLTDKDIDNVSEVHVFITGISTQPRGGPVVSFNKELGDVELLSLSGRTIEVVNTEVPTGTYDYVAFRIDEQRSRIVESGVTKPLRIPNGEARVLGPFEVMAGRTTTITLDFDAEKSLTRASDGSWSMQPVVVVVAVTR